MVRKILILTLSIIGVTLGGIAGAQGIGGGSGAWAAYSTPYAVTVNAPNISLQNNTGTIYSAMATDWDTYITSVNGQNYFDVFPNITGVLYTYSNPFAGVTFSSYGSSGSNGTATLQWTLEADGVVGCPVYFDVDFTWVDGADYPIKDSNVTDSATITITN